MAAPVGQRTIQQIEWHPRTFVEKFAKVAVILGIALAVIGAFVALGAVTFGGSIIAATMVATTYNNVVITYALTTTGKVLIVSAVIALLGAFVAGMGMRAMPRTTQRL